MKNNSCTLGINLKLKEFLSVHKILSTKKLQCIYDLLSVPRLKTLLKIIKLNERNWNLAKRVVIFV